MSRAEVSTLQSIRTSRLAQLGKHVIRDALWQVRGVGIRNPPLPERVDSILFVCLGNICRSPYAAVSASRTFAATGVMGIRSRSAGIRAKAEARAPQEAQAVAEARGFSLAEHCPQVLTADLMNSAELVVVMDVGQLRELRAAYPDFAVRLFLLPLFDPLRRGYRRYNIADPYSRPRSVFEECYDEIDRAVRGLGLQLALKQ